MTSRQLLLHIGTGKTGTTSIQESLYRGATEGTLSGINYPPFEGRSHNFLAVLYKPFDHLPREYRGPKREELGREAREFKEALFQSIRDNDKTILSGEYLSRFTSAEVEALRTDLIGLGVDDVRVVVYVRNPASLYLSTVQQNLKAASLFQSPSNWRVGVTPILRNWSHDFADLVVRPFVKELLVNGDVVSDFLQVAADFFGDAGVIDVPIVVRNESISAEGMIVLQRYRKRFYPDAENRFRRDSSELVDILERSWGEVPQTRPRLSPLIEHVVMRRHEDDLDALWTEFGVDLRSAQAKPVAPLNQSLDSLERGAMMTDVAAILQAYDEDVVNDLLLHCLRTALVGGE